MPRALTTDPNVQTQIRIPWTLRLKVIAYAEKWDISLNRAMVELIQRALVSAEK